MRQITDLKEFQQISLNILKFVDKVCKEHNIKYCLGYGTALGAVRHGGFIPWDDDIDILMTRDNYDKFLSIMKSINDSQYKCIAFPDIYYKFAKVVDTDTVVEEINKKEVDGMGIYIDIFPVDNVNAKTSKKDHRMADAYKTMGLLAASTKFEKSDDGLLTSIVKWPIRLFAKIFGWKFWIKKAIKRSTKYNNIETDLVSPYDATREKAIYNKSMFENLTTIKFEDTEFPIMKDYDKYLTQSYGDYMTPPPKDKQKHHACIAFHKNKQEN